MKSALNRERMKDKAERGSVTRSNFIMAAVRRYSVTAEKIPVAAGRRPALRWLPTNARGALPPQ